MKVLLLHALTGGPEAADSAETKGWWGPLLREGAPLGPGRATVWCPNLPGSCYGSVGPRQLSPFPALTPRDIAAAIAVWAKDQGLTFDLTIGGSLGGMVALELALLEPELTGRVAVLGTGGRADSWLRAQCHAQIRILELPIPDDLALAAARRVAMLGFRSGASLEERFAVGGEAQWLDHHGQALANRFDRESLRILLGAMFAFDIGKDRGGLTQALEGLKFPLHVLGIPSDTLFLPSLLEELAEAASAARRLASFTWLQSPHGHDAFLMEWDQLITWLDQDVLKGLP